MILLIKTVDTFFHVISLALLARALLSWINPSYEDNPISSFIYRFTEPFLIPMRKLFDKYGLNQSMIDFSFLATIFALAFIRNIIINILSII